MKRAVPALFSSALVLPHVSRDGAADLRTLFVLSEIIHKLSVGSHQVHDDGVIHLKAAEDEQRRASCPPGGLFSAGNSRCNRCPRLWDPG